MFSEQLLIVSIFIWFLFSLGHILDKIIKKHKNKYERKKERAVFIASAMETSGV